MNNLFYYLLRLCLDVSSIRVSLQYSLVLSDLAIHVAVVHFDDGFPLGVLAGDEQAEGFVATSDSHIGDEFAVVDLECALLSEVCCCTVKKMDDNALPGLVDCDDVCEHVCIYVSELHELLSIEVNWC